MSEIVHKTQPIEHWIVDGKAYRLATEGDIDKFVYRSDRSIERALEAKQERLASVWVGNELRFECHGFKWRYAYIQDDSLLQPKFEHVVDCVTVEQRIAERIIDDKKMKQAKADVPKPIDWTKPVRTKDGRAVRVLCTDGPGEYPVVGIISDSDACARWTIGGKWRDGKDSDLDLENVSQRIQREYWMNVYEDGEILAWEDKYYADKWASKAKKRFACVKITIDCEEGEGL